MTKRNLPDIDHRCHCNHQPLLPDGVLGELDLVVASAHTGLGQDSERIISRALSAIRHPLVKVLAHPTGRIVGGRSGGDFDMDTMYAETAKSGTVLEIDGDPSRMDLRDGHARTAIAAGRTLSLAWTPTPIPSGDLRTSSTALAWRRGGGSHASGWSPMAGIT